jgi:hypothetical protein
MLRIILLAVSLILSQASAFAAGDQPPPKTDQRGDSHDCGRQHDQTSRLQQNHISSGFRLTMLS